MLADLFVDEESIEDGWQYRYIPLERYSDVVERLRSAGIAFVKPPATCSS